MTITDLQENELFTELTPEEVQDINGGGFWGGVTGAFTGAIIGFAIGGLGGAATGASIGWTVGDAAEDEGYFTGQIY
jgi:uncharacterized membrane protein